MKQKTNRDNPKIAYWTLNKLSPVVANRINAFAEIEDVERIAVLPDVHLTERYCVGTAVATRERIFPDAVGADIGCGMLTLQVSNCADRLAASDNANQLMRLIERTVPVVRQSSTSAADRLPAQLSPDELTVNPLRKFAQRDGRVQLGTIGRGNHFVELQVDDQNQLWILVHSGSRGIGQAIYRHHRQRALRDLKHPSFVATSQEGKAYLQDVAWAARYAQANREAILWIVVELLSKLWNAEPNVETLLDSDHNHVRREAHFGRPMWIHRKGVQGLDCGQEGVIPGSMGTATYHVTGKGLPEGLCSSSHGAGRRYSRTEARRRLSIRRMRLDMKNVFYDRSRNDSLLDESPAAYNDIHQVLRAQRNLVRVTRILSPVLNIKG